MRGILITVLLCISLVCGAPYGRTEEPLPNVGVLQTPAGMAPDECYQLLRNGIPVEPLVQNMYVFNGDIIIPLEGNSVKLIYRHTDCGEIIVSHTTTVTCDPRTLTTPGGFLNLLPDAIKKTIRYQWKLGVTNHGKSKTCEFPCFPDDFLFSVWPLEGAAILYGEPILFRWANIPAETEIRPCSESKLIIIAEHTEPVVRDMKIGELLYVRGDFQAGTSYEWHVEKDDKRISRGYHFSILGEKESDNIRSQIAEVARKYEDRCPGLRQALYLQIISDSVPELDLCADSFRLMREYKECLEKQIENNPRDGAARTCLYRAEM